MPWELTDPQQQQRNPAVVEPVPKLNKQLPNGVTLVNPGTQNTGAALGNNTYTPSPATTPWGGPPGARQIASGSSLSTPSQAPVAPLARPRSLFSEEATSVAPPVVRPASAKPPVQTNAPVKPPVQTNVAPPVQTEAARVVENRRVVDPTVASVQAWAGTPPLNKPPATVANRSPHEEMMYRQQQRAKNNPAATNVDADGKLLPLPAANNLGTAWTNTQTMQNLFAPFAGINRAVTGTPDTRRPQETASRSSAPAVNAGPDTPPDVMRLGAPLSTVSGPPEKWTREVDKNSKTVSYKGPNDSGVSFVAQNLGDDLPLENYLVPKSSSGLDSTAMATGNKNMAEGRTGGGSFSVVKMESPEDQQGGMDPAIANRLGKPELAATGPQGRIIGDSGAGDATQQDIRQAISANLNTLRANTSGKWSWDKALKAAQARKALEAIDGMYQQPQTKGDGITAGDLVSAKRLEFDRRKQLADEARQREQDNATYVKDLYERIKSNPPLGDAEVWINGVSSFARENGVSIQEANELLAQAYATSDYAKPDGLGEIPPSAAMQDILNKIRAKTQQ